MPPENEMIDISGFKVNPQERPEWCPEAKINKQLNNLSSKQRQALENIVDNFLTFFSKENNI